MTVQPVTPVTDQFVQNPPSGWMTCGFGPNDAGIAALRGRRAGSRWAPPTLGPVIFKAVGEGRPYPDHGLETVKQWAEVPPRQVRLDELVTTKRTLDLDHLLAEDSTFYGDLFAHVVQYKGVMYLEDGLHRAVRAALQQRPILHARVLVVE